MLSLMPLLQRLQFQSIEECTCYIQITRSFIGKKPQEEKVPIWLVGDWDRRFCEYPIIRRPGYDWGLSYNNSRTFT